MTSIKLCKYCREEIPEEAIKCRHCNSMLIPVYKKPEFIIHLILLFVPLALIYMMLWDLVNRMDERNRIVPKCDGDIAIENISFLETDEPIQVTLQSYSDSGSEKVGLSNVAISKRVMIYGDAQNKGDGAFYDVCGQVTSRNKQGKIIYSEPFVLQCIPGKTKVPFKIKGPLVTKYQEGDAIEFVVTRGSRSRI